MGLRGGNWLLRNTEIESCDCCSPAMLLLLLLVVWLKGVGFDGTGRGREGENYRKIKKIEKLKKKIKSIF